MPLIGFALPVLAALFLQTMYGAVDLLIVGQYAATTDVSAVATGSQLMHSVTTVLVGLAMGVTVLLGQKIGQGNAREAEVIAASAEYLKAYAIDCLLTSFLFCFIGYFSGLGRTVFVMAQGLIGAFLVRIPVSYAVSRMAGASLFAIGLATPASTLVQIILCAWYMRRTLKQEKAA